MRQRALDPGVQSRDNSVLVLGVCIQGDEVSIIVVPAPVLQCARVPY